MTNTCAQTEKLILRHGEEHPRVREHAASCAACAALLRSLAVVDSQLPNLATIDMPEQLRHGILQHVAANERAATQRTWGVPLAWRWQAWLQALSHRPLAQPLLAVTVIAVMALFVVVSADRTDPAATARGSDGRESFHVLAPRSQSEAPPAGWDVSLHYVSRGDAAAAAEGHAAPETQQQAEAAGDSDTIATLRDKINRGLLALGVERLPTDVSSLGCLWLGGCDDESAPQAVMTRIIDEHTADVRDCYAQGLQRNGIMRGNIEVTWLIDAKGDVLDAKVLDSEIADPQVGACLTSKVQAWRFPARTDSGLLQATYLFRLRAGI